MNKQSIQKVFDATTKSALVHEAVLFVENSNGDFSESFGYGSKDIHFPIFMGSVTKLFITTCILILHEQKKLSLDDYIGKYIEKTILDGLHIYKGKEYSHTLKISDLLFQTSGLAEGLDIFLKRAKEGDFEVAFEQVLDNAKSLKPRFVPNKANKAYYSDMNFRLLVIIIEKITENPISKVYLDYICIPLGMNSTYLPTKRNDLIPNIYYKDKALHFCKLLTSGYNYDAISTSEDLMRFIKAFWGGNLFSKDLFEELSIYKKLQITMGPIFYGGGFMQIPLGTVRTLFMGKGELIGHSSAWGAFAFYYPEKDLFFVGEVNQIADPGLPIFLVMKLAMINK